MAYRDQAGDSLPNVLQKPSKGIIYQGNKEVVEESRRPKRDDSTKSLQSYNEKGPGLGR